MDVLSCRNNDLQNNIASTTHSICFIFRRIFLFFHKKKILNNTKDSKENVEMPNNV